MKAKFSILILAGLFLASQVVSLAQTKDETKEKPALKYQGEVNLGYSFSPFVTECWSEGNDSYNHTFDTRLQAPLFTTIHGISLSQNDRQYGFFGIGVGLNYQFGKINKSLDPKLNTLMMPIFFNVKAYFPVRDTKLAPYFSVSIGGSICLQNGLKSYGAKNKGGFYYDLELGLRWGRCSFAIGSQTQFLEIRSAQTFTGVRDSFAYEIWSPCIKIGISF